MSQSRLHCYVRPWHTVCPPIDERIEERVVSEKDTDRTEPVDPAEGRDIPRGTDEHADSDHTRRERERSANPPTPELDDKRDRDTQ
jgi:hypothetical protein